TVALAITVYTGGPVEMVSGGWPTGIGITLRADALGAVFAVVVTAVLLAVLVHEVVSGVRERAFPALVLFMAAGLGGLFLTGDVFNFYVFFEVSMTTGFVLASYGQEQRQIRDALTFTVVNLLGSVLFLNGVAALYHVTGTLDMRSVGEQVDRAEPNTVILIAVLFFVAFSLKLGLFPFHNWLPPVYEGTHPAVAAILSGALANIGSYGLLRFGADLFAKELQLAAPALLLLGGLSVVYGAVLAASRRTAPAVLAYSSISQAGYILIALAVGGSIGYGAAVVYTIVNALNKTLLFLAAGLRGWFVAAAFAVGGFSVAGVPPSAGFFGKAALFRVGIEAESLGVVLLVLTGGALSFVYMFQSYQREFWERSTTEPPSPLAPRILVVILAGLVVGLGIWPEPLLAAGERAARALMGEPS
ncbi:MAG: oxidoreductase, partial [Chloroflexi bacterium]|nr:oxidoreductase [Chloroflexota bacterium]